ncbi:MAG: prepilin-type N-terminal cleavage/methylation domain-containing protein [Syntrophomonadaceae bacterium]|nr:prepilin-type N-terminal cleavage/methylation domain-containing protein [Syntrophomonadaceae bacterium]
MNKAANSRRDAGFTLIELVVVLAILAILAATVIPRYSNVQMGSRIKADVTTATAIIDAARVQELNTGKSVTDIEALNKRYFLIADPVPQSGGTFDLTKTGGVYRVIWTATEEKAGEYADTYVVTEGESIPAGKLYGDVAL